MAPMPIQATRATNKPAVSWSDNDTKAMGMVSTIGACLDAAVASPSLPRISVEMLRARTPLMLGSVVCCRALRAGDRYARGA